MALADGRFSTCSSFQRSALFSETGDFSEEAEAGPFRLAHQPAPRILLTPLTVGIAGVCSVPGI